MLRFLVLPLVVLPACSTVVTPDAIRASDAATADQEEALRRWAAAVRFANEFLVSPYNYSLPPGRYELDDAEGLRFVAGGKVLPIEVRNTWFGDVVVWAGFIAQERSWGFVVGDRPPDEVEVLDNTMFRTVNGVWKQPELIAELMLHETAHVVHRVGTIGTWRSLKFYLEVVFLLRTSFHSDERRPRATSEEYHNFVMAYGHGRRVRSILWRRFQKHREQGSPDCRHGVPERLPRGW